MNKTSALGHIYNAVDGQKLDTENLDFEQENCLKTGRYTRLFNKKFHLMV